MSIFDKEYSNPLEIQQAMTDMVNSSPPFVLARFFMMAKAEHERQGKEEEIRAALSKSYSNKVRDVYLIEDGSAIIKVNDKLFGEEVADWYFIYFNGRTMSSVAETYDQAIIMLLCQKYGLRENGDALELIMRMLGMKGREG